MLGDLSHGHVLAYCIGNSQGLMRTRCFRYCYIFSIERFAVGVCVRVPRKRGGGARGASGYREVAISGSFAMNRFHFIVLPLPFAIFLSTILRLCIFLSYFFVRKGGGGTGATF